LVEKVLISDPRDEPGLQPTVFYRWQKEFFENGTAAFQQMGRTNHYARRASAGDSGRARPEVGGGERPAEESPPACRVTDETDYFRIADHPGVIA
jgi:hypothetical protein